MLDDKNFLNKDNRNLSEVFKELQEMQKQNSITYSQPYEKKFKPSFKKLSFNHSSHTNSTYQSTDLKLSHIIIGCSIVIIAIAVIFPKNSSFSTSYAKVEEPEEVQEYELNRHRLNIQNIISENSEMDRVKEQVTEEREVEFETIMQHYQKMKKLLYKKELLEKPMSQL